MDEDVTRLAIHSEEPKIILHGSGNYIHVFIHLLHKACENSDKDGSIHWLDR